MNFELTKEEAQFILNLLVEKPYVEVVNLVNKIQEQAHEQLNKEESE